MLAVGRASSQTKCRGSSERGGQECGPAVQPQIKEWKLSMLSCSWKFQLIAAEDVGGWGESGQKGGCGVKTCLVAWNTDRLCLAEVAPAESEMWGVFRKFTIKVHFSEIFCQSVFEIGQPFFIHESEEVIQGRCFGESLLSWAGGFDDQKVRSF